MCRILSIERESDIIVVNEPSLGKTEVPQMPSTRIESSRVFPIVRGRDIHRWQAIPVYGGLILNSSTRKADIPSEREVKHVLRKTYAYLYEMRPQAIKREKFWQFFSSTHLFKKALSASEMKALGTYVRSTGRAEDGQYAYEVADGPFFALFNVGSYTFAPFKVCWPMGASRMRAAVVSTFSFEVEGKGMEPKCVIPATGTTSYAAFESEDEAHYLCALLNSEIADAYVRSFSSAGRGFGAPSILSKINLPRYDPKSRLHLRLSLLSKRCHDAAAADEYDELASLEAEVNIGCAELWGLSRSEVESFRATPVDGLASTDNVGDH
jgi:hypothetical protein